MRDLELKKRTDKERREWYKSHGMCTSCGQTWAEPGKVYCKACAKKMNAYHTASREKRIEAQRQRRAKRIAAGICTECGKRKATEGMRMCPICREKRNDSTRKYKIHQRTIRKGLEWEKSQY